MKPLTNQIKEQLRLRIKNKIDIADLLEDVNIKGEDLSWAIISKLRRIDSDISGCNFSHCILGNDKDIITFIRCNMEGCNFESANFIGKGWIRICNVKNSNFRYANVSNVSYEHSDFSGASLCGAIIRLGSREYTGSSFDESLLFELTKGWKTKYKFEKIE